MTATQARAEAGVLATLRSTPRSARYLLGGVLINQAGAFVQTFLVLYLAQQGLSVGRAGTALAAYSVGTVVGLLIGGELAHRIGSRATIAVSMAGSACLVLLIPTLSRPGRFTALLIVVAFAGAATQAYRPAAATLLSNVVAEEHRVMAFSMLRIAMNVGAALGPLLAAALILVDWDLLFYVDGATALAYSALAMLLLPPDRAVEPEPAAGVERAATDDAAGAKAAARSAYAVLVRDVRFQLYLLAMLLSAVVFVQFTTVLPLALDAEGYPTALYSAALVTSSTILILCELKITTYVRHWVAGVAAGVGTVGMTLGVAGFGLAGLSAVVVIASTVVFVSGIMISGPTLWAHPAKAPAAVRGRYIGASQAVFGLGSAIGPVVGVLAWSRWGAAVWLLCLLVGFASAGLAVAGLRERPQQAGAPIG